MTTEKSNCKQAELTSNLKTVLMAMAIDIAQGYIERQVRSTESAKLMDAIKTKRQINDLLNKIKESES